MDLATGFRDLGTMDALGARNSVLHRLDPRAKVLVLAVFVVCLASMGRYEVAALLPFALFPVSLAILGELPLGYLGRRVLVALPFVLVLGCFNPLLDRAVHLYVGRIAISGGWLSYASMVLRLVLSVAAVVATLALTGIDSFCQALDRLGLPKVFTLQVAALHRYAFVLAAEASRMLRARELRANGQSLSIRDFGPLVGSLLLRAWDRARRIYTAMLSRGFEGESRSLRTLRFSLRDTLFLLGWSLALILFRWKNLPQMIGAWVSAGRL